MLKITFQNKEDAQKLLNYLHNELVSAELSFSIKDKYTINFPKYELATFKNQLREFIINDKRDEWLKTIISEQFHFSDFAEQQQIIAIVHSLLAGERDELLPFLKGITVEENLTAIIEQLSSEKTNFSFDAFVQFRLKSLISNLEQYVIVAIDEYKMEQEYQIFIHTLRHFIKKRPPKIKQLHLLFGEKPAFYDQYLQKLSKQAIKQLIAQEFLPEEIAPIDYDIVAPLLLFAPQQIHIYTNDSENMLIRTIQNIFEERIHIYPFHAFYSIKKTIT